MEQTVFSVSEVNRAVKQYLEGTPTFRNMYIQGELSNITYYRSGHLYFTLKDDKSSVKCAIFKYIYKNIPNDLKEGDHVKIMGSATVYEANGSFQIIAETLEKTNKLGSLFEKLEMLKKMYLEKGYFDDSNKKPLPQLPVNVGVVTAETGAAIRDIINTTHKRFRNVNIYLYPAKVQGEGSATEVASGIEFFNRMKNEGQLDTDVLIVGRGGGSIEDLWSFNEEPVIEAIFKSEIPVISAVGHEIDNLLSDLVADRRAATPTQAAEILIPVKEELMNALILRKNTVNKLLLNKVAFMKKELEQRKNSYYIKNFVGTLTTKQDRNPNPGILEYPIHKIGRSIYRNLTPRECFLLMGFSEQDFDRVINYGPRSRGDISFYGREKLERLAGNSIVVAVLEKIFEQIIDIKNLL